MGSRILEKIDELVFAISCPVEYQWVKAHNGNEYNEMADELYEHANFPLNYPYDTVMYRRSESDGDKQLYWFVKARL